jgi:hypothetical protein
MCPRYSYECPDHGMFELAIPLSKWDDKKPCPEKGCELMGEQVVLPNDSSRHFVDPVVVHVASDGTYRFPGAANAKVPKGFEKRELRTIREIEAFERDVNTKLYAEARQHKENEEKFYSEVRSQLRGELRQRMQSMSQLGRDFAKLAMALNDDRKSRAAEPGFHLQILHFDQTNREEHRDAATGWKKKYV